MKICLSVGALATLVLLAVSAQASSYPLSEILDKASAEKLAKVDIKTSDDLLKRGATAKDRQALVRTAKVGLNQLTSWVKMCDLLRIKGVGPEMVRLLAAAGVTTVKQLRAQKPPALMKKLTVANKKKKITENPPTEEQLGAWIDQAKKLDLVLR
jgi:predicted flap endonuclease-1-like 5' DNA nuclease